MLSKLAAKFSLKQKRGKVRVGKGLACPLMPYSQQQAYTRCLVTMIEAYRCIKTMDYFLIRHKSPRHKGGEVFFVNQTKFFLD